MASSGSNRREQLRALQEAQARQRRNRRIIGIVAAAVAVVLVFVVGYFAVTSMSSNNSTSNSQVAPNATESKDGIVMNPGKAKQGVPTIDVYLDYQCPICRVFEARLAPTLLQLADAGDIKLVNHTMTFMDDNMKNTASSRAAYAATCADSFGAYSAFNTAVFEHQQAQEIPGSVGYEDSLLRQTIPTAVGISGDNLAKFQQCYDQRSTKTFVDGIDQAAYKNGVTGTPTIKRNGQVLRVIPQPLQDGTPATTPDQMRQMALNG